MSNDTKDQGVILAILDRFNKHRLPRAQEMKKRADRGELLNDEDHSFIAEVLRDAKDIQPLLIKHPEYQSLYLKAFSLWKEIIDKDMENQKKSL